MKHLFFYHPEMKISRSKISCFFEALHVKIWLKQKKSITNAFTRWLLLCNLNDGTRSSNLQPN